MRLRWVGDSRDYVKWDCVFENANGRFVFYVPMLRNNVDPKCMHSEVQEYFDAQKNLDLLERLFPGRFAVFSSPFPEYSTEAADEYFRNLVEQLRRYQQRWKVLIFIDPDTGVEPPSGAKDEHLRSKDLRFVWEALAPGGRLIVYQHASRSDAWKQPLGSTVPGCVRSPGRGTV